MRCEVALQKILTELKGDDRSEWPAREVGQPYDLARASLVAGSAADLLSAAFAQHYDHGTIHTVELHAIRTAAMALKFLLLLEDPEATKALPFPEPVEEVGR